MEGEFDDPVPLRLTFLTDDKSLRKFAREYWAAHFGPGNTFQYRDTVGVLAEPLEWSLHDVKLKLPTIVVATYNEPCSKCQRTIVVRNRWDLQTKARLLLCEACLSAEKEAERRDTARNIKVHWAEYDRQVAALNSKTPAAVAIALAKPQVVSQRDVRQQRLAWGPPAAVDSSTLSLVDAVYLSASFRASQSESLPFILPIQKTLDAGWPYPISPGSLFTFDVMKHLAARRLIGVAPESHQDAFTWTSDDRIDSYYVEDVVWRIAPSAKANSTLIEEVEALFRGPTLPLTWRAEILPLWRAIALHECIEFLKHELSKHSLPFQPGPKTRMVFEDGLTTYSVSQLYNAIFRAAKDAAAYYMEKSSSITRPQAANSVVGRIQNFIEYARVQKWDVNRFRRNFDCPRSEVSRVLFDVILKIGVDGFDLPPRELVPAVDAN